MSSNAKPLPNQSITEVDREGASVRVKWADETSALFSRFWLRDNCPSAGDKRSGIRHFTLADIDSDLSVSDLSLTSDGHLTVQWAPEDHISQFDADWLYANRPNRGPARPPKSWRAKDVAAVSLTDFSTVQADTEAHFALLSRVVEDGFALVSNVPDQAWTEELISLFGIIQENDFGGVFDIISEPNVWDLSQSDEALHVHTDDPYRYTPPGISVLHCVEAGSDGGGTSVLVDGFAVGEALREVDPDGFELLATVKVPFIRYRGTAVAQGDQVHLRAEAPIFTLDNDGNLSGVRFHERSMGALDLMPELADRYYPALIKLCRLMYDPSFEFRRQLQPGEAIVFDNVRVLHGRTAFTGSSTRRHMRLTKTDRDQFHSKFRLLAERFSNERDLPALISGVSI